jgi:hypothetical protein
VNILNPRDIAAPADEDGDARTDRTPVPNAAFDRRDMPRALVSRTVLDALIRNKLANTLACDGVEALPVVVDGARTAGCNWKVPGWTGAATRLHACRDQVESYVRFLATQFDIPEDSEA